MPAIRQTLAEHQFICSHFVQILHSKYGEFVIPRFSWVGVGGNNSLVVCFTHKHPSLLDAPRRDSFIGLGCGKGNWH